MKFLSTKGLSEPVSFSEAVLRGLAPDGGLYMPEAVPRLRDSFWESAADCSSEELALEMARPFVGGEFSDDVLRDVIDSSITFDAPLVPLYDNILILELFHGPTLAFKDFGARFMAQIIARLEEEQKQDLLILVATSGDTGSAVASGFYGVSGINVCLLYPSGKVSLLQEKQMTTLGGNVTALEVNGTFDDCQRLVKQAFRDRQLREELRLSSANSINFARLLPQTFYYAYAFAALKKLKGSGARGVFSVPSGNFGNLTAGLLAMKMGMPAQGFIAATNVNDVVPEYLKTGKFNSRPSVQTISNAMDVGDPSNFDRIVHLFSGFREEIRRCIQGYSFDDEQTRSAIKRIYQETGYTIDPHTAVGVLAAEEWDVRRGEMSSDSKDPVIVLSTAHPAKFADIVEEETGTAADIPQRLRSCLDKEKKSIFIGREFKPFKRFLLDNIG